MLLRKEDSSLVLVDVQEKLAPYVIHSEKMIARCKWMLKLAQQLSVPILVTEQYPRGLGNTVGELQGYAKPSDKVHFSCWPASVFQEQLKSLQKSQVILIGIETHVCVLQTAFDLLEQGFEVYVVVDAVSSRAELDKQTGLNRMQQAGVQLVTSEMVFFEWVHQAGTPEFKSLSATFMKE